MKKSLRFLSLFLSLLLALGGSALAFEHDANLNEGGVEPICKETVKLTIGMPLSAVVSDFDTNYMTTEL